MDKLSSENTRIEASTALVLDPCQHLTGPFLPSQLGPFLFNL